MDTDTALNLFTIKIIATSLYKGVDVVTIKFSLGVNILVII